MRRRSGCDERGGPADPEDIVDIGAHDVAEGDIALALERRYDRGQKKTLKENPILRDRYELVLLTGWRIDEIRKMSMDDFNTLRALFSLKKEEADGGNNT